MSDETLSTPRVHHTAPNCFFVEHGLAYEDGYRVTVGWSEEDQAWIARCSGLSTGAVLADGPTRETALLDLACSLGALVDAVNKWTR